MTKYVAKENCYFGESYAKIIPELLHESKRQYGTMTELI